MANSGQHPNQFDWAAAAPDTRQLMIHGGPQCNRSMRVKILVKGDHYGLHDALIHEFEDPLVEFYDLTAKAQGGQFIARYNLSTLLAENKDPLSGLCLDGGEPEWVVQANVMVQVRAFLALGPTNGCHCPVCEQHRAFRLHLLAVPAASRAFFEAIYDQLMETSDDLSMANALIEGRLPNADALIARKRERKQSRKSAV